MNTNNNKQVVFTFRISLELLEQIKLLAEQNKRSAGKEIEFRLEQSLKQNQ